MQPSIFIPLYFHLYAYHVDFQDIQKQVDYSCLGYSRDITLISFGRKLCGELADRGFAAADVDRVLG